MRELLAKRDNQRGTFRGTVERFGIKSGWQGREEKTILLRDITDLGGQYICDHLWLNFSKTFQAINPKPGDKIEFDARVKQYYKGYMGYREDVYKPIQKDYRLSHPTKVRKYSDEPGTPLLLQ